MIVQSGDGDHGYGGETDQPSHYFGPRRVDYAAVSDRGVKCEVAYYQTLWRHNDEVVIRTASFNAKLYFLY